MDPTPLVTVLDGISRWSVWNEPRKLWFNGHHLILGGTSVVIDPVPMSDEVADALDPTPPTLCVITNRDHERAADQIRARWNTRVLIPRGDVATMTLRGEPIGDGDTIAGDLRALAVRHAKSPGELALHSPSRRLLILGDAAIGRPSGALSMLPADKLPDLERARVTVAALADLAPEIVLVGDGDDILAGGAAALRALAG